MTTESATASAPASTRAGGPGAEPTGPVRTGLIGAWLGFWFTPTSPLGLHWIRVLAGLLFLSWLLPLTGERAALFGLDGWVGAEALRKGQQLQVGPPPIGWSLLYLDPAGANATVVEVVWWSSLVVLALFTIGVATRITSVLTWVIVVSFLASPASQTDADYILAIVAFYLMIGYLFLGQWGRPLSLLERILGPRGTSLISAWRSKDGEAPPSHAANFVVRLLQIHFAVIVVTSGLHKLQFADWWAGVAYWYPLHPPMQMDAGRLLAERSIANATLFVLSLAEYIALAWQITFPIFAFRRRFRPILLGGAAFAWLGSMFVYGDPVFGPLYALGCLTYLTPDEWRWLTDRLGWPGARGRVALETAATQRKQRVKVAGAAKSS